MTIEKIRKNKPDDATHWRDMDSWCSPNEILYYTCAFGVWCAWNDEKLIWEKSLIHFDCDYILEQLKPL